jgi:hypothetical protein
MEQKEFIFTIARMNPPTTGHKDLIKQMASYALANGSDKVHVILSHTTDEKNPLPCDKKREIVKQMVADIEGVNVIIICMDDPTDAEKCGSHPIMKSICHALSHAKSHAKSRATSDDQYMKAVLFVGEDRASSYKWIGTAFAKNQPPMELELVALERTTNPISATKIRELIKANNYPEFVEKYNGSGLSQETLRDMFSSVQSEMQSKSFTKKRKLVGGTKRRKKTRSKRRKKSSNRRNK